MQPPEPQGEYPARWKFDYWAGSPFNSGKEKDPERFGLVDGFGNAFAPSKNYGKPGDILWVREEYYQFGHWEKDFSRKRKTGRQAWKFVADDPEILYADKPPARFKKGRHHKEDTYIPAWYKRLGRFMPKEACRLFLRIKSVRVERLQEIEGYAAFESPALAEGIMKFHHGDGNYGYHWKGNMDGGNYVHPEYAFKELWQSINGTDSWDTNPWVWVIEFERIEKPEGFI